MCEVLSNPYLRKKHFIYAPLVCAGSTVPIMYSMLCYLIIVHFLRLRLCCKRRKQNCYKSDILEQSSIMDAFISNPWKRTNALIFDIGHNSTRFGYSSDVAPTADIPSFAGVLAECVPGSSKTTTYKYAFDTNYLCVPRKEMEIVSFMKNCMIEDWIIFENFIEYIYVNYVRQESHEHPVLMSEAPWNMENKRKRTMEIMFEKYNVPALFLENNATLASFASGCCTSLVVDSGATHTSVIPVINGCVWPTAIVRCATGGDYISSMCNTLLETMGVEIIPHYLVRSKQRVRQRARPKWVMRQGVPEVTPSWYRYQVWKVLQDFQATVLHVSAAPYKRDVVSRIRTPKYEFPNGYNLQIGCDRFCIPEALFKPNTVKTEDWKKGRHMMGIPDMIKTCVAKCDRDVHLTLYNNIVVTGGNSLLKGYPYRLLLELRKNLPSKTSVRVLNTHRNSQQRYTAWIGGSVVASSPEFQEKWMTRVDYMDGGRREVEYVYV